MRDRNGTGRITAEFVHDQSDMHRFVDALGGFDQGAVIKPNWTSGDYGFFTDRESLELLLKEISGPVYVVESYMFGRTDGSIAINSHNGKDHWMWLRDQDRRFLETSGIGDLLADYNAEYINITEEWWSGRCVPGQDIREIVEARFRPVSHQELYDGIPSRLMDLRHLPFISYAKFKYNLPSVSNFSSFSMKNVFGMIPVPNREYYHGVDQDVGLSRSIIDIVSIYQALFSMVGIVEGVYRVPVTRNEGDNRYSMIWTDYDVIENAGVILGADDMLTLDAYANQLAGIDPATRAILRIGEEVFGPWNREAIDRITPEMMEPFR